MNFTTSAWPFFDANSATVLLARLIDISTLPKQQLYNSRMPTSRCGVQYSPAVAVHSMHSRSVVAGLSSLSVRCLFQRRGVKLVGDAVDRERGKEQEVWDVRTDLVSDEAAG